MLAIAAILLSLAAPPADIQWRSWSPDLFRQAKAEHRFVLLDLGAVWCHWCHVMDERTYRDGAVRDLIREHYIAVRVDQDANPELSLRYERWGWPATVVFAPDGTEIVKRRGYLAPDAMASLLRAIVDDPTPGPSITTEPEPAPIEGIALEKETRRKAEERLLQLYDARHGGWGNLHRMLDAEVLEYAIAGGQSGDAEQAARARKTLHATLRLLDPVWGGLYQYSDEMDWSSPHFEKLTSIQAQALRAYSLGYAVWKDPELLHAAQSVHRYLQRFLQSPEGAFYVSQDADLSPRISGHAYYAWDDRKRRARGIPRVDKHLYARENGWVIAALCGLADATGDDVALAEAKRAAEWVLSNRRAAGGGFVHGAETDEPVLGDTLAMVQAFFALYQSTADRAWLLHAEAGLSFVARQFGDASGAGYTSSAAKAGAPGVFERAVRHPGENAELARVANLLYRATGNTADQEVSQKALRHILALGKADLTALTPVALLAEGELGHEPLHLTLVGRKDDAAARALFAAGRALPSTYRLLEWLDLREGPLPHPVPPFPHLSRAAVFVCDSASCSLPLFQPERIAEVVKPKT